MAVNYANAVKTARMTATRDQMADGSLQILTSADTVLVTFGLSATGGSVSGNVWTLAFDNSTVAASGTGTAAKARIRDAGDVDGVTGLTVSTGGADIVLDNLSITSGQNITLNSATITHAP